MMNNDAGLRVRIDPQLRQDFISACRHQDQTAAQVLRAFMRDFVAQHQEQLQGTLFESESK